MDYNVEAEIKDIIVTAGDTINISYSQYLNSVLYDMTGMQLDCQVKDSSGNIIKTWSSAGVSPAITISTSSWNISDLVPLTSVAKYIYDMQLTNGSEISTIRKGNFIVQKQIYTGAVSTPVVPVVSEYRIVERGGILCIDKTLTATGFAGVENVDWENIQTIT